MKQAADTMTAELPGLSMVLKRGRPCVGARPMTAAERKRRSRHLRMQTALLSSDVSSAQVPVQLNAVVDERTRRVLRQRAAERGLTMGELIDQLMVHL